MQDKIDYEKFYEDFFRDLIVEIEKSKREVNALHINDIISEAQKLGHLVNGMEKEFLKGMLIYLEKKGIKVEMDLSIIGYLLCENENEIEKEIEICLKKYKNNK